MIRWNAVAPEGQVFICAACGKEGKTMNELTDISCKMHAVLCYERTPEERAERRATAVETPENEQGES
jgi:DNA-directed RNA polymerase subunit RPC12/RpoP